MTESATLMRQCVSSLNYQWQQTAVGNASKSVQDKNKTLERHYILKKTILILVLCIAGCAVSPLSKVVNPEGYILIERNLFDVLQTGEIGKYYIPPYLKINPFSAMHGCALFIEKDVKWFCPMANDGKTPWLYKKLIYTESINDQEKIITSLKQGMPKTEAINIIGLDIDKFNSWESRPSLDTWLFIWISHSKDGDFSTLTVTIKLVQNNESAWSINDVSWQKSDNSAKIPAH